MKKIFFLTILTLLFSISCKSSKNMKTQDTTTSSQYSLTKETKWVLTSFNGQEPKEAGFKERLPYMVIDKEAGSIGGNSGCNSFNGPVEIDGSNIKVGMLAATKAYCMGVPEHEFFTFLNDADNYKITGEKLQLLKGEKVLMEFSGEKNSK